MGNLPYGWLSKEEIQIVLKRYSEKIVLYFYRKECEKQKKIDKGEKK